MINDPEKWRASMEAAKSLIPNEAEKEAEADGAGVGVVTNAGS